MPQQEANPVEDDTAAEASSREEAADMADAAETDGPCAELPLTSRLEAILLSTDRPLSEARLAEVIGLSGKGASRAIREAMDGLNQFYESSGRSFRAERLAGGWQLLTNPEFGPLLDRLHAERQQTRLSQAALETLAIVGYRQPIMRAEIEAIRGVSCGEVLRSLMERRMVKIVGRAEELGRPMLYGTTTEFLKVFGLSSVDDLPEVEGVRRASPRREKSTADSGAGQGNQGAGSDDGGDDKGPAAAE